MSKATPAPSRYIVPPDRSWRRWPCHTRPRACRTPGRRLADFAWSSATPSAYSYLPVRLSHATRAVACTPCQGSRPRLGVVDGAERARRVDVSGADAAVEVAEAARLVVGSRRQSDVEDDAAAAQDDEAEAGCRRSTTSPCTASSSSATPPSWRRAWRRGRQGDRWPRSTCPRATALTFFFFLRWPRLRSQNSPLGQGNSFASATAAKKDVSAATAGAASSCRAFHLSSEAPRKT